MRNLQTRLREGRLSQLCPACGLVEAAGYYCTSCRTPTGEGNWFTNPSHNPTGSSPTADKAVGGTQDHPDDGDDDVTPPTD